MHLLFRRVCPCFALLATVLTVPVHAQSDVALAGASRPKPQLELSDRDRQYKRIHQYALRLILRLHFNEAQRFLLGHLNDYPRDAESHYLMGIWHARQGHETAAAKWFQRAIDFGLPPGRVIAGPRGLLRNLRRNHPFFRELDARFERQLAHGPLLGNVTHNQASIWVRTGQASSIRIIVSESPTLESPRYTADGETSANDDYAGVIRLTGLQPQTRYFYQVEINGETPTPKADLPSFETYPKPGTPTRFRVAFGGGSGYVPPHERAWTTIETFEPDALLLFGDNVYIDDPESLIMQRYTYHRRQSRPEWRHLTAQTPVFSIWDDHDFGTNDCWGGPKIDEPFWKPHYAFRTFRENWANPGYGGGESQPGCWYTFTIGDVDFVMLDCRYYRTNPKGDHPSMLGPVQLNWLQQTIKSLDGTFKVICSSVPWDFRTKGDSLDTWNGYKEERERIFSFLESHRIDGVLLMSADRHRSDAWRIDRPEGYSFYEFNSSRLTNQHVHKEMNDAGALFSYNEKQSFGIVDFDTTLDNPTATYSVVSIDGEIIHELTVSRDLLNHH